MTTFSMLQKKGDNYKPANEKLANHCLICEQCKLKSIDVTKKDLEKHENHIVRNQNIQVKKMSATIEELKRMLQEKSVVLDDICYICNLTKDIEDLVK